MENGEKRVYYNAYKLDFNKKREILIFAKRRCFQWCADEMRSSRRIKWEVPFEKIMRKFTDACHVTIVHRKTQKEEYGEVSFSSNGVPVHSLVMKIGAEKLEDLIEAFDLKAIH
jgi:hypothetical protein